MCKPYTVQCFQSQVPLLHAKNQFQTPVIPLVAERNPSRSQFPYGRFIHPPHFKTPKIHSCRSPIFHCLCSHHNHFISHHYYIMTSHILSTSEFHVGSIFHYDSSQSFILYSYWMMWNSLRSTFQWSCPIDSDTSSGIEIRVLQCPGICMNQCHISLLLIMGIHQCLLIDKYCR